MIYTIAQSEVSEGDECSVMSNFAVPLPGTHIESFSWNQDGAYGPARDAASHGELLPRFHVELNVTQTRARTVEL